LAAHLPVLVVLGVERTSTAAGSHALQLIDTKLVPAGLVEEIRLPPLDPARIERALGLMDGALLGQLRALVQGRPGWLDEIWGEWRDQGVVVQRDGQWTAAPDARDRVRMSLHGRVELALRAGAPDGDGYWRALEVLRTAALEGQRFTAEAVADVLGEDVEDLIDWIDEHLADPDGPSLVVDDGFVERADGVDPPALRCYRFCSPLVAGVLRQEVLAGTNGKLLAGRYARALAHRTGGRRRAPLRGRSPGWRRRRATTSWWRRRGGGRTAWRVWRPRRGWRGSSSTTSTSRRRRRRSWRRRWSGSTT
jgi:hypothetical protein